MSLNDPINALAQLRLWQIEVDVLSKVIAGATCGAIMILPLIFGQVVVTFAFSAFMIGCGLVIVWCLGRAVYFLMAGIDQRRPSEADLLLNQLCRIQGHR